jgi:hypothetical protein
VETKGEMISHMEDKFAVIREMDGISPLDIMQSLSIVANRQKVF